MTKEHATLLAQVIPVVALAIGLELRSLLGRYETARKESDGGHRSDFRFGVAVLSLMQLILTAAEVRVLEHAGGRPGAYTGSGLESWLGFVIAVAFLAPVYEAVLRILALSAGWVASPRRWAWTPALVVAGLGAAIWVMLLWVEP